MKRSHHHYYHVGIKVGSTFLVPGHYKKKKKKRGYLETGYNRLHGNGEQKIKKGASR